MELVLKDQTSPSIAQYILRLTVWSIWGHKCVSIDSASFFESMELRTVQAIAYYHGAQTATLNLYGMLHILEDY